MSRTIAQLDRYVIQATGLQKLKDQDRFWSAESRWSGLADATLYTREQLKNMELPKHECTTSAAVSFASAIRDLAMLSEAALCTVDRNLRFLADLNGSDLIQGEDAGAVDMRERAHQLEVQASGLIFRSAA